MLGDRLSGKGSTGHGLVEALLAATHEHVDAMVDGLFRDRAETASLLAARAAVARNYSTGAAGRRPGTTSTASTKCGWPSP